YTRSGGDYTLVDETERLLRYDPESTTIRQRVGDRETVTTCPLGADFDATITTDTCAGSVVRSEDDDYGTLKVFGTLAGMQGYAPDIGLVEWSGDASQTTTELVYSNVGGVERGTPFSVSAAPTPEAALRLTATPSVTAGPLAVHITGARGPVRVEAFDVRGRLVLSRIIAPEARAEVDASGWAPGLYLVRATAGETTPTVRVVRR
ncbi:MAG: T9SS type A sorting domain-containing protein, partial [Bacteroidota bacterium]